MNNKTNHNGIFRYVLAGALLFIAAFAFSLAFLSNIVMLELSYTFISLLLITSSIGFLYKAIKNDKNRLGEL